MPLIAAYFDTSLVSFLIKKDKRKTEFLNFPYVYSDGIFSNQCNKQEFYTDLIKKILTENKMKVTTSDVLVTGFLDAPEISLKTKLSIGVMDLIKNTEDFMPVLLNNCSFVTEGIINSFSNCRQVKSVKPNGKDFGEFDYHANLCIYPQIIMNDVSAQTDIDKEIVKKIPSNFVFESGRKVVFTGGRFAQNVVNRELSYILMLESLKGFGVFYIYLDKSNSFILSKLLQMYDREMMPILDEYIEHTGLVIRTGGQAECLLSTGIGDDQFIEIEKDRVFVMPLRLEKPAKISIKSETLGTIDIRTKGGEAGLIFDTRSENVSIYSNIKLYNDCIKQFERVGDRT